MLDAQECCISHQSLQAKVVAPACPTCCQPQKMSHRRQCGPAAQGTITIAPSLTEMRRSLRFLKLWHCYKMLLASVQQNCGSSLCSAPTTSCNMRQKQAIGHFGYLRIRRPVHGQVAHIGLECGRRLDIVLKYAKPGTCIAGTCC